MPTPLLTDVTGLAQSLIAPVRAGFWYGSVVEDRCTVIPLTEGYGNSLGLPTVGDFFVDSVADGARMDQMQAIAVSTQSITAGLIGGQFIINAAAEYSSRDDLMALASTRILNELRKKRAVDILSLAASWSAAAVCGTGTTLTWGHLVAADTQLEGHANRKASDESRKTALLHANALHPVIRSMMGAFGTNNAISVAIPTGLSEDTIKGNRRNRKRPALVNNGMEIYVENYLPIASNNSTGMAFFEDGIVFVPAVELEEKIHDKVPGLYGAIVDVWARYGYGLGPFQADGLPITALASAPTS